MALRSHATRTLSWLRCRRFRSRDALLGLLVVVGLLHVSPTFFRVPRETTHVAVEPDGGGASRVTEVQPIPARPAAVKSPLTDRLERLDALPMTGTSNPAAELNTAACGVNMAAVHRPAEGGGRTATDWQRVNSHNDETYVISAHVDTRWNPTPLLQVIGMTSSQQGINLVCRMWFTGSQEPFNSPATVHIVSETHGRRYAAFVGSCPIRDDKTSSAPYAVTLLHDVCDVISPNVIYVDRPPTSPGDRVNYTVCVTPLNYRYNNFQQLVETIEVNRLFGAQHFVLYNYSTGPLVDAFLEVYRREGLVTVVPWSVPVSVDVWPPDRLVVPAVHYFAQLAALNDCLYRSIGRSTLLVYTDLDEILVPRGHSDWTSMLDAVSGPSAAFPGAYIVRSSFFRTDWPTDELAPRSAVERHLVTLTKTQRETKVYDWTQRSKYVVWTKAVQMVGVHDVLSLMPGAERVLIDHDTGLVHHYRLWFDDANNPPVTDRSMHRFTDDIVKRVQTRYALIDKHSRNI